MIIPRSSSHVLHPILNRQAYEAVPSARGLASLTPTCVSASRLAGGSAPRPLAASQHVALAALNFNIQLLLIDIALSNRNHNIDYNF